MNHDGGIKKIPSHMKKTPVNTFVNLLNIILHVLDPVFNFFLKASIVLHN
jgi:hypothetical protein